MNKDAEVKTLSETENYAIWVSKEPESGEAIYHVELVNLTLHFFEDEWEEFTSVVLDAVR